MLIAVKLVPNSLTFLSLYSPVLYSDGLSIKCCLVIGKLIKPFSNAYSC